MKNELGNTLKQSENPQNVTSDVSRYIVVSIPFQLWVLTGSESGVELPQMSSPVNGTWVGWLGWRWLWQFVVVSSQANPIDRIWRKIYFFFGMVTAPRIHHWIGLSWLTKHSPLPVAIILIFVIKWC